MTKPVIPLVTGVLLLFFSSCGPPPQWLDDAQETSPEYIEVLSLSPDRDSTAEYDSFHLLANETHVDSLLRVGRIQASMQSGEAPLNEVIHELAMKANSLGANAFQVREAIYAQDTSRVLVDLEMYAVSDALLERNEEHFPRNRIYIIGELHPDSDAKEFKLNGEQTEVEPLRYISIENEAGEETTISIGGFLGAKMTLEGRENRPSSYWSLSEFGVGPYAEAGPPQQSGLGVSFNTGRIHPVNPDAGRFLIRVLQEQETL